MQDLAVENILLCTVYFIFCVVCCIVCPKMDMPNVGRVAIIILIDQRKINCDQTPITNSNGKCVDVGK